MNSEQIRLAEKIIDVVTLVLRDAKPVVMGTPAVEVNVASDFTPPVKKQRAPWGSKSGRNKTTAREKAEALVAKAQAGHIGRPRKDRHYACNDCMNDFHSDTPKVDVVCPSCDSTHVTEV